MSRSSGGLLSSDVSFDRTTHRVVVADFGVGQASAPTGVVTEPAWERAMSVIAGTPSVGPFVGVLGYSDCLGSERRNTTLRGQRADAVRALMPPVARVKVLLATGETVGNHLAGNDTAEDRARNRAVVVKILPAVGPGGTDPCDFLAVASDLDQWLFLVRCLERRLGLTTAADAPTTLSVLRQIYYGSASWTDPGNRNPVWDDVITQRPWSPGTDPSPRLGRSLFNAVRSSQRVVNNGKELDVGHLLTGLDAARRPADVEVSLGPVTLGTGVKNHAWATWAGDLGSAAAQLTLCTSFLTYPPDPPAYFTRFASDSDLEGDIDAYAVWAALNHGSADIALRLDMPLSDALLDYYRTTRTTEGAARQQRFEAFANFYGGDVRAGVLGNRTRLTANLLSSVQEFALLFGGDKLRKALAGTHPGGCIGTPRPTAPGRSVDLATLLADLVTATVRMTDLFVDWIDTRL